jgi:hypothetical protein
MRMIRWDRFRLDQVITNLLGNAMKFGAGPLHMPRDRRSARRHDPRREPSGRGRDVHGRAACLKLTGQKEKERTLDGGGGTGACARYDIEQPAGQGRST